jgi:hypothetical protein
VPDSVASTLQALSKMAPESEKRLAQIGIPATTNNLQTFANHNVHRADIAVVVAYQEMTALSGALSRANRLISAANGKMGFAENRRYVRRKRYEVPDLPWQ